ncbi:MAG: DUF1579 family protein [Bryobacteraceae bacterium]
MKRTLMALCACAFLAAGQDARTGDKSKEPAASEMPKPTPAAEMKELTSLAGTWSVEEIHEPSPWLPEGGTGKGTANFRLGPGGFSVMLDYKSESGVMPGFHGHGLMTFSESEKVYKSVWVDSVTQDVIMSKGTKQGGNLVYAGEFTFMGKKMTSRDVISDRTPNSFTATTFLNDGSGEKKAMTVKYTRK